MIIKDYVKEKHFTDISLWLENRKFGGIYPDDLPQRGFVISNVACGFLIITDTNTGIIDFLLSNPDASILDRGKALNLIIDRLIELAHELGFDKIKCDSQIESVKKKAKSLGFKDVGTFTTFYKEINHG